MVQVPWFLVAASYPRRLGNVPILECPLKAQFGVLGRKWTLLILRDIGFRGIGRFGDLSKSIARITPRILSVRLRQLEAEGLIEKRTDVVSGTAVWGLTRKGTDLLPLLIQWVAFRSKWDAARLFSDGRPRALNEIFH
jgi:DNA-binding HxlR family transcriptional regulator